MERQRLECSMCFYTTIYHPKLVRHFVRTHRYDADFMARCSGPLCGATFRNWTSFKKHVQRKHRDLLQPDIEGDIEDYVFNDPGDPEPDDQPEEEGEEGVGNGAMDNLQLEAAKFLLHIRDRCKTSQKAMFKILEGVNQLAKIYIHTATREIQRRADPDTETITIAQITEVFQESLSFTDIFSAVNTKTKLNNFLVEHVGMLIPQEVELGRELVWVRKPEVNLVEVARKGFYIPFLASLRRLLLNNQVRKCVDNPRPPGETMKTILDGKYYRNHPFFSTHVNALGIILYYDEIEICNPIGPKKHKLGMFYWTLANIYPEHRSTFHAINLYGVVKFSHLAKFGAQKMLQNFVDDIRALQRDGITLNVAGENKTYKGSLLAVTGDNPASAFLGGFKRAVSASKPCRRCMTDQDQYKLYVREDQFILRNMQSHSEHVAIVTDETLTQGARKFWSTVYGVNNRSILMDVDDFDITKCLVQDVMHVLSEGVLEIAIFQFIKYCVTRDDDGNSYISLEELNRRIDLFDYGHLSRDKPGQILNDHLEEGLKQSAAQMVCLGHVLPFLLVGKLVAADDGAEDGDAQEHLMCHIRLLQIVNICFAYEICEDDISFLKHLMQMFLELYKRLYPNTLVPKFHFLLHIINQAIEFGPPRQHFCMRFEAAHSWFKSLVPVVRSFKNMPWTLSYRYEALRCLQLTSMPGNQHSVRFLYQGHCIKEGISQKVNELLLSESIFHHLPPVNRDAAEVMISPEISVHGCVFKGGSIILISCNEDSLPEFAKVTGIYIYEDTILLAYQSFPTVIYCQNLNAYQVNIREDSGSNVINIKNLMYPHPLSIFTSERLKYIVLFNHVRSEFIIY